MNTDFDDRGRIYSQKSYLMNQTTGVVAEADDRLSTGAWYDLRGNMIKTAPPGGMVQKTQYDGAGRSIVGYVSDGGGDTTWTHAGNVTEDVVPEQTETLYDANSNTTLVTQRARFHDALDSQTGPLGDKNSNPPVPKARVSFVAYYYDALNRKTHAVAVGTYGGNIYPRPASPPVPADRSDTLLLTEFQYNSAGWLEWGTDPRALKQKTEYDNLGRVTKTIENYDQSGTPTDTTNRTTEFAYNGNDQVTLLTAVLPSAAYQKTQYDYGVTAGTGQSDLNSNDLLALIRYPRKATGEPSPAAADQESFKYNGNSEKKVAIDRNRNQSAGAGTTHEFSYDVVGRLTSEAITVLGDALDNSVRRRQTAYDTAGRAYLFTNYNSSSGGTIVNEVQRSFNGLGQLTTEYQAHGGAVNTGTTPKVQYAYSEMPSGANHSRLTKITYPNNRVLRYEYNAGVDNSISRLSFLADQTSGGGVDTHLEEYSWLGLGTVVKRARPEIGVDLNHINQPNSVSNGGDQYTGFDRFGRVVDVAWRRTDATYTDRFQYGYDRNGNRLYRDNLVNLTGNFDELYHANGDTNGYDGFDQLTEFRRGPLSDTSVPLDGVPDTVTAASRWQKWTLDVMGNWDLLEANTGNDDRGHNKQNQITAGAPAATYDDSGNTKQFTDGTQKTLTYDAWDRLIQIISASPTVTHEYDALNRRIQETRGSPAVTTDLFYSDDWQVLEEKVGLNITAQYVWSPLYIDALILYDDPGAGGVGGGDGLGGEEDGDSGGDGFGDGGGGIGLNQRHYVQQDANWNVSSIVDAVPGSPVIERYVYDPFGQPTFLDASWNTRSASLYSWVYLHQGGRRDAVTNLYHFRNRELSATMGRWLQVDPIGYQAQDLNLYRFVGNGPIVWVDPMGLQQGPGGGGPQGGFGGGSGFGGGWGGGYGGGYGGIWGGKTWPPNQGPQYQLPPYSPGYSPFPFAITPPPPRPGNIQGGEGGGPPLPPAWTIPPFVGPLWDPFSYEQCGTATPKSDTSGCDIHKGIVLWGFEADCVCRCAGSSDWDNFNRGCLECAQKAGVPSKEAHERCYAIADAKYGWREGLKQKFDIALTCTHCLVCGKGQQAGFGGMWGVP